MITDFQQGATAVQWGKRQSFQETVLGKFYILKKKDEFRLLPIPYTHQKFQMAHRPSCKS